MEKTKKIPQRKCLGCAERRDKGDLLRIVRTPEGDIRLDEAGKAAGRGAYICKSKKCLSRAHKSHRLEQNLGTEIPDTIYAALEEAIADD